MILGIPVWAIAAAFLAIGELLTPGLFLLGPLAVVAVVAALVASVVTGGVGALLAFIGVAAIRPRSAAPARPRSSAGGRPCSSGSTLRRTGEDRGEEWSARPYLEGEALPAGAQVEVAQLDGAMALILR